VRLAEATLRQLRQRARREGTSVSALIRGLVERGLGGRTVYGITADLAGGLAGSARAATNARSKFCRG